MIEGKDYIIDSDENDLGDVLILKTAWSDSFIDIIKGRKISVLRLSESMGWSDKDVSFLSKLEGVELRGVEIYCWGIKNILPLEYLPDLQSIAIQSEFTKAPDFSNFNNLTNVFFHWRLQAQTIFNCKSLKSLNIVNYPSENLHDISGLNNLIRLQLTSRKLISLSGVEKLLLLNTLDLAGCTKLIDLSGIDKCLQLTTIELQSCKKITDICMFKALSDLSILFLIDCGKIKSLNCLSKNFKLKRIIFSGDTNIEDGELADILHLPILEQLMFANRRHYSHTRETASSILS